MSKAEQDQVVDECYQCKLCYVKCPYVPPHEWQLDFPRLMLRAEAVRHQQRGLDLATQFLGRTDLLGKVGTKLSRVVNRATGTPGSLPRRLMERTVGVAAERVLPPFARKRFSTWFRERALLLASGAGQARPADAPTGARGKVAVFTTCLVEYQDPGIGQDLVKVYERNGIACELPEGISCCGMPWLDGGDVDRFLKDGERNVPVLAAAVRAGCDIVVPQPTCTYVLKREYPAYLPSDDVAPRRRAHLRRGRVPGEAAQGGEGGGRGPRHRLHGHGPELGGAARPLPPACPEHRVPQPRSAAAHGRRRHDDRQVLGHRRHLGLPAENYELSRKVAQPLRQAIEAQAGSDPEVAVVGDCHLANGAILQETGRRPQHPIQLFARAYGIAPEEDAAR